MAPTAPKKLTVDEIYETIKNFTSYSKKEEGEGLEQEDEMDDLLHQLNTTPRPTEKGDIEQIFRLVLRVAFLSGSNSQSWKRLALTIIRRRYHLKSPEAKLLQKESTTESKDVAVAGDGERQFFYVATTSLYRIGCADFGDNINKELACVASSCLCRVSLLAGGSRDACSLIEYLLHAILDEGGYLQLRKDSSHSDALAQAAHALLSKNSSKIEMEPCNTSLRYLLKQVADTLEEDLKVVRGEADGDKTETDEERLMSTFNVFVPHNDRGSSKSTQTHRKLVQCIAEALIWSQNEVALSDQTFTAALNSIRGMDKGCDMFEAKILDQLHKMQTIIRRLRKELNSAAREKGFMLRDQFLIDDKALTVQQIKKGKTGDVTELTRLATKAQNKRVLELISNRFLNEKKAIPVESVSQLRSQWIALASSTKDDPDIEDEELRNLQLKVQRATVKATISDMKKRLVNGASSDRENTTIISESNSVFNHASAILVGAAMCQSPASAEADSEERKNKKRRGEGDDADSQISTNDEEELGQSNKQDIILQGEDYDVSSLDGVIALLDELFSRDSTKFTSSSVDNTLKNIMNAVDRHAKQNGRVLMFVKDKPEIPERYVRILQERNCKVHCHLADDLRTRLEREEARLGDITCSLAWDTHDDLDIHVIPPSGTEIYYGNRRTDEGVLDVDMNAGSPYSSEPVENVYFGDIEKGVEAPHGKYKVFVQNYAYHTKDESAKISWRVSIRMNNKSTDYEGFCVGSGSESNSTVVEFDYAGRTVPMADELPKSAGDSANVINITTSVGFTRDALCQLFCVWDDHEEIGHIMELAHDETDDANEDKEMEAYEDGQSKALPPRSRIDVTSRDRLNLQLFKLPRAFHSEVESTFGGSSLVESCAAEVASRLVQENINIDALSAAGYPRDMIEVVKEKIRTFAMKK